MQPAYVKRREEFAKRLSHQGIEKVLVCKPLNIYYLTGIMIKPYERFLGLTLDISNRSYSLIVPNFEKGVVSDPAIQEVLYKDEEDPIAILIDVIGPCNVLGMDMDYVTTAISERIKDYIDVKFTDVSIILENLRIHKDEDEVDKIQTSAIFADEVLYEVQNEIQVGRTEKEILFNIFKRMLTKPGVIYDQLIILVLGGENSSNPRGITGTYKFKKGDPVTIDFGLCVNSYWSEITRTFFIGKPSPEMGKIYKIILDAQIKALEQIRPGVPIKNVDLTARSIIEKAGYGEYFTCRTGHGLGLSIHEKPSIIDRSEDILEEGMVFTVEPGIYLPKIGGVRIEDNVVVTKSGCKILTAYPKKYKDIILSE